MKVCGRLCVCDVYVLHIALSPLIFSISVFLYLHVCARSVRYLAVEATGDRNSSELKCAGQSH